MFSKPPMDVILFHLCLLGILFCMARWPIFGRPRDPEREAPSDFGKHVDALGELLERTGDKNFASSRLLHYRQTSQTEALTPLQNKVGSTQADRQTKPASDPPDKTGA